MRNSPLLKIVTLGFALFASVSAFAAGESIEEKLAAIDKIVSENAPANTEQKAANLIIAFTDLMGAAAGQMAQPVVGAVVPGLIQSDSLLAKARGLLRQHGSLTHPQVARALQELRGSLNELSRSVTELGQAVVEADQGMQNLAGQMDSLNVVNQKYPNAYFATSGLASNSFQLTKEMAAGFKAFAGRIGLYATALSEIARAIDARDPGLLDRLEKLAVEAQGLQQISFASYESMFNAVRDSLKAHYGR